MKFTLGWLKEHLDTKASVEAIAETLTRIGLEVEDVFDPATALRDFRVAQVVKCEKHPNADKLKVCEVDTGTERLQVVCGEWIGRTATIEPAVVSIIHCK